MHISIDGKYYLKTDENNFILQEIKFKGSDSEKEIESYFINVGYYGKLQSALKGYLKYSTRNAKYGSEEINTMEKLIAKLDSIEIKIDKVLSMEK